MLYKTGHGSGDATGGSDQDSSRGAAEAPGDFSQARSVVMSASRFQAMSSGAMTPPEAGAFRYYFPDAPAFPESPTMVAALDDLGTSMFDASIPSPSVDLAPILTYFGQFIDHDITANTDRRVVGVSEIDVDPLNPTSRDMIVDKLDND